MSNNQKFRIRHQKFLLEYTGLYLTDSSSRDQIKELALEQLSRIFVSKITQSSTIDQFIITEDLFIDGSLRLEMLFILKNPFCSSDPSCFNLKFEGKVYQACISPLKNTKEYVSYLLGKNKNISNISLKSNKLTEIETLFEPGMETGLENFKSVLYSNHKALAATKGTSLCANLSQALFHKNQNISKTFGQSYFKFSQFDLISLNLFNSIKDWCLLGKGLGYFPRTLVLTGKAGTGKTQLARTILNDILKINFLEISSTEELYKYSADDHKGLLIDDISFQHLTRDTVVNLLDSQSSKVVRILYGKVQLTRGMPRIVTTNSFEFAHRPEIMRRVIVLTVDDVICSNFDLFDSKKLRSNNPASSETQKACDLLAKDFNELQNNLFHPEGE